MIGFLRRPQLHPFRRALFQVHLWAGVAVALYVVLIGVTGAALVFRPEFQAATFPEYFEIPRNGEQDAAPGLIIQKLRERFPGASLAGIDFPTYRRDTYLSYLTRDGQLLTVFSHPVTGDVMAELPKASWITQLQDLHFDLLGGSTGRLVNGIAAAILVLLFATGIVVWWPGIDRWVRSLWVDFRGGWKRINWDLHSVIGFWLFGLLMLWAVTGVEFAFPQAFRRAVNAVSPLTVFRAPQSGERPEGASPVDASVLVEKTLAMEPNAIPGRVVLPSNDKGAVMVLMARERHGDFDTNDEVHYYFDQFTGELLLRREIGMQQASAGDIVMKWLGPLHVGSFGGQGVKALWGVLALSFPALAVTGLVMWWNRVIRDRYRKVSIDQRRAA